jgi:hypothetical protein
MEFYKTTIERFYNDIYNENIYFPERIMSLTQLLKIHL